MLMTMWPNLLPAANSRRSFRFQWLAAILRSLASAELGPLAAASPGSRLAFAGCMKSPVIWLTLTLVSVVGCGRTEIRRLQFLQNGTPAASASISLLYGSAQHAEVRTGADGSISLPADYHGGIISIKVEMLGTTMADGVLQNLPPGESIFSVSSNNNVIITHSERGVATQNRTVITWQAARTHRSELHGAADRGQLGSSQTNQTPVAAGPGG